MPEERKIVIKRQQIELKEPTTEQVRGWLDQDVGKYFKALLEEKLIDLQEGWANGEFTGDSIEETSQRNSEAIGKTQAYADIILTLEEMTTDEKEEEITD